MQSWVLVLAGFGGGILLGLIKLMRDRKERARAEWMSRPKVTLELSAPELALLLSWSSKNGQSLAEWSRKALLEAVPRAERVRVLTSVRSGGAVDAAFEALDYLDENEAYIPRSKVPPTAQPIRKLDGHPCGYLNAQDKPAHFQTGECSGLCLHPEQKGRVCFWAAENATQCPKFRHRNIRSAG